MTSKSADVVVIGSGPAGLAAATRLRSLGVDRVIVLERESEAGGVPRHCDHASFGLREFGRPMTGPGFVSALLGKAVRSSVAFQTETTVLEVGSDSLPYVISTSPQGIQHWQAQAIILATGCRERPRPARLIPGSRAPGVFTTGELQQFTYLHQTKVGRRAVVVGAEHVSFSAVMTLRDAGIACAAVITPYTRHQSYRSLRLWATGLSRTPLLTEHRLTSIDGRRRVEAVTADTPDGPRRIECDTVIMTGEWVAEGGLALRAGLSADVTTGGRPEVTFGGATAIDGVFAAGGVVHPGESASSATSSGATVAKNVASHLRRDDEPPVDLRLGWSSPIRWLSPQRANRFDRTPFRIRVDEWVEHPTVVFQTDGHVVDTVRLRRMIPGRTYTVNGLWMGRLEDNKNEVQVSIGMDS